MIGLIAAAAVSAASPQVIVPPGGALRVPSPPVSDLCRQAMGQGLPGAVSALEAKRYDEAKAAAAKLAPACEGSPGVRPLIATFTAEADLLSGDAKAAVAALDDAPPPENSQLWLRSRFIYLVAYKALGDDARFIAERDHLLAVNAARMLAGDDWTRQERFETPVATVEAFRRRTRPGEPNDTLFIAAPKTAEMPASYQVDEDGPAAAMMSAISGKSAPRDEIGDLNMCTMHASLTPTKADYSAWRAKAVELFSDPKSFEHGLAAADNPCPGWRFIFPALVPRQPQAPPGR